MLFSIIFWVLLIGVFGRLAGFAFRLSWKILKVLLTVVFLPLALIGLFLWGLVKLALPILIIVGIISLLAVKKTV